MCSGANSIRCEPMQATVFDIKEFTVHDGPGPRVTVFFKGCPLRCQWCHNPEGLERKPQLLYREALCGHCGACRTPCAHEECAPFGRCIHACPNGCLHVAGRQYTSQQLGERLQEYRDILAAMGGGVTLSGGEPLLQGAFIRELLPRLAGIHVALQTSGYAEAELYRDVVSQCDLVMQDIKLVDPQAHVRYTGVSNEKILHNISWLKNSGIPFVFRVPLIPGITDTEENLRAISEIVEEHPVELLPYNPFAGAKYSQLGMQYQGPEQAGRSIDPTCWFKNGVLLK